MKNSVKKKNRIKRWFPAAVWLTAALCFLSGCSFSTTSNTTVALDETGKLTEEIIEELGDDDFTVEELQEYIDEQLAVYNRGKEEPAVTLQTCRVENGDIRLALRYASCDDYAAFNQIVCFQGTLKEAEDAGYTIDTMALLEPNGQKGDLEIIREREKEWKIFIVSEPINVKVPDKILYASDNVKVTGRLAATVKTVLNEEKTPAAESSGSEEEEAAPVLTREERLHPLSTVTERYAYIIYK